MEANELRLGNLILHNGKVTEVESVSLFYVNVGIHDDGLQVNIEDCSPIPLTEEWLLKFRFKYREFLNDFFIKLDDHNILIAEKEVIGFAIYKCEENQRKYFLTKRYYVHQLQNLFFRTNQ